MQRELAFPVSDILFVETARACQSVDEDVLSLVRCVGLKLSDELNGY